MASNQNTLTDKGGKPEKAKPAFNLGTFVKETRAEIAKVSWPTRQETLMTTVAIVVMALVVGLFFFGVDSAIGYAIGHLLGMSS